MNAASMRRLAKDHATLRMSTPPNYLFPDGDDGELPDDLTQLIILITGADATPYSQGLWRLQLKIPADYPKTPPKANFKTRIFHPNVDENTGAVCLETLKRDWQPKLTLKDILVTISCLLINPNPDSALNAEAGSLLQEDYDAFAKKAKLMTSIHAPVPKALKDAVAEAKRRGEDGDSAQLPALEERPSANRSTSSSTSVTMKTKPVVETQPHHIPPAQPSSEDEGQVDNTKENDPLHLPLLPTKIPPSPRKVLGKRSFSDVPLRSDSEQAQENVDGTVVTVPFDSNADSDQGASEPLKKSPKLSKPINDAEVILATQRELNSEADQYLSPSAVASSDDKENFSAAPEVNALRVQKSSDEPKKLDGSVRPTLRKVSNVGSSRGKNLPRVGIRRL